MTNTNDETVTIKKKTYERLLHSERTLRALEAGGVDNWDGYYYSMLDAGLIEDEEDFDDDE